MSKTVAELANLVGGKVLGDEKTVISGITNMESPLAGHITFVQDEKNLHKLEMTEIACLIVPPTIQKSLKPVIQVPHPKLAWAKLLREYFPAAKPSRKISSKASVAKSAKIGARVTIEPFAVVQDEAQIGDDTVIQSHAVVGFQVKIGAHCVVHPSVVIYEKCEIGSSVIIHAGTVIGADGFGYVPTGQKQEKVPQVGNVVIENDVELGACVTIDRATIGSTRIGEGTKIDNTVQIGHNVVIGKHTVISSQTGISGSSKIGSFVTMGGKVGVGDHVEIGDWTVVGAGSGFPSGKKIPPKQIVFGEPARPYQEARKQIAAQLRSAEMLEDLRRLRDRVNELEKKLASGAPHPAP